MAAAVQVYRPITVFESVPAMAGHYGYKPINKVLSISEESPSVEVTEALKLGKDGRVIRIERLRLNGDTPILYCIDYVPRAIIPAKLYDIDWSGSLLNLMEQYRNRPRMSAAKVSAVLLPEDVVQRHDLADFGPALLIAETCFNVAGEPVIYAVDYHRGSHFTFSLVRK
jgi:GntR family transcriptional regulator